MMNVNILRLEKSYIDIRTQDLRLSIYTNFHQNRTQTAEKVFLLVKVTIKTEMSIILIVRIEILNRLIIKNLFSSKL